LSLLPPLPLPLPPPNHRRHRRGHLYRRCRRNRIRCSYHRSPHLAAAFIAAVDATVIAPAAASPTQIPSTQLLLLLAVAIATATTVVAAVAVAFAAAIVAAIALASAVTIAAASTVVSTTLVWRRLMLGLAATTTQQGAMLQSSRHGGEVWR
jgi:hypothetical protein